MNAQPGGHNGRLVTAVAFAVLVVSGGILAVSSFTRITTRATSSPTIVTTDYKQEVMSAYAAHIQNIESKDPTAIVAGYENNATVKFAGRAVGIAGTYVGKLNILLLFGGLLSQPYFSTVNLTNMSYAVSIMGNGTEAAVNSTFTMHGNSTYLSEIHGGSPVMGTYTANVNSATSYALVGDNWLISNDAWDFINLDFAT